MNDPQTSIWNDALTLLSISVFGGVIRRLSLGEKYTLGAFAISACIAAFVGVSVGMAIKDYVASEGLRLGVVAVSSFSAPELLVIAVMAIKKKGSTEVKKL